jgi:enolase
MAAGGKKVMASCPSGTSVGKYEARVLPAKKAVLEIKKLFKKIVKKEFSSQENFDQFLKKQSKFANVILPLSIGFSRLFGTLLKPKKPKMPKLLVLAFEGGVHSHSSLKIQEFLFAADNPQQANQFYQKLKNGLEKEGIDTDTGLEGGFAPNSLTDEQALGLMAKYLPQGIKFGLDFGGRYFRNGGGPSSSVFGWLKGFKISLIEDPFGEDDLQGWLKFYGDFGKELLVVGDDLVATNIERLKKVLKPKMINAVIVKPNQIGTVSETLGFVREARKQRLKIIVSHRSGETNDPFIADLAVSVAADFVKFGGFKGGERIAKYNRLSQLASKAY